MKNHERAIQNQHQMPDIAERILLALRNIRYGSVEIIIHDSKVVQIERKEKLRFDADIS